MEIGLLKVVCTHMGATQSSVLTLHTGHEDVPPDRDCRDDWAPTLLYFFAPSEVPSGCFPLTEKKRSHCQWLQNFDMVLVWLR